MNKKRLTKFLVLISTIVLCTGVVAFASSLTTEIKAILSREVTIRYCGEVQNMKDGSGNPVYPIMYNGTTYLPVRAVSNMLDIPVDWDASTKTVILGTEEKPPKSVLSFEGDTGGAGSKVTDKGSLTVKGDLGADIVYNDGISFRIWNGGRSANIREAYKAKIEGGYTKLSFDAYVAASNEKDIGKTPYEVIIYDVETENKLAAIEVIAGEIKKVEDIDITGVKTIGFAANCIKSLSGSDTDRAFFFNPVVYSTRSDKPVELDTDTDTDTDNDTDVGDNNKQSKSVLSFESDTGGAGSKVTNKGSLTVKGDLGADIVYNDGISFRIWNGGLSANIREAYKAKIGGGYTKLSFDAYVAASNENDIGKTPYEIIIYDVENENKLASIEIIAGEIKKVEGIDITGVKTIGFAANCIKSLSGSDTDRAYFFNPVVE